MRIPRALQYGLIVAVLLGAIAGGLVCAPTIMRYLSHAVAEKPGDETSVASVELAGGNGIRLPREVAVKLGIETERIERATAPVMLDLSGTLMLDSDRFSHVRARFAGEIVELGGPEGKAPVGFGQRVRKGQLLAVIWSRDLGEKKSDLIDSLSQLRVDQESLDRINKAAPDGAIPDRMLRDAERKVEADQIAAARAVRTLQSWRVSKEEIDAVRAEAQRIGRDKMQDHEELVRQWARVEVRSPLDGVIIEKNVALGDLIDTSTDLFKVADLSRLRVTAHAYEEDLPALDALQSGPRTWSIVVSSEPGAVARAGSFDQIGSIIDPNQHTALVMGWVDNPDGHLRAGQFVTARIPLPPPKDEIAIPSGALVEEGGRPFIFVQPKAKETVYARQPIAVARRAGATVFVRGEPSPAERKAGAKPLHAGQRVVSSGTVQLAEALRGLQAATAKPEVP
jgi:cobalt-zinc-cadmium efflux system membrane fusion protein